MIMHAKVMEAAMGGKWGKDKLCRGGVGAESRRAGDQKKIRPAIDVNYIQFRE